MLVKQTAEDAVPFIDVNKTYPEKELNITDFADVSYIHLNTINGIIGSVTPAEQLFIRLLVAQHVAKISFYDEYLLLFRLFNRN